MKPKSSFLSGGFLTVEAALLMPVLLAVVFLGLYLAFYLHDRNAACASAAEQAVSGKEQEAPAAAGGGVFSLSRTESRSERVIVYSGKTVFYTGRDFGAYEGKCRYRKLEPAKELRRAWGIRKLREDRKTEDG